MNEKFNAVPSDLDTRIIKEKVVKIASYDALYQKWNWDGIVAESLIFVTADVEALDDEEIKTLVSNSPYHKGGSMTFKRCETGYVFVNFGFSG